MTSAGRWNSASSSQQQDALVRKARLAGTDTRPAADDRRRRRAVVRCAKRRRAHQWLLGREQPGDRMDSRDLERGRVVERRQDARQPARQHRLPRPGRPGEKEVLPPCGGDLERAAGALLATHLGEVGERHRLRLGRRLHRFGLELAAQVRNSLRQVGDGNRPHTCERRFRSRLGRAEQALDPEAAGTFGDRENATDAAQAAV
jgi:hypothetical protein